MGPLVRFGIPALTPQPDAIDKASKKLAPVLHKVESLMGISVSNSALRAEIISICAIYVQIDDPSARWRQERDSNKEFLAKAVTALTEAAEVMTPTPVNNLLLQRIWARIDLANIAANGATLAAASLEAAVDAARTVLEEENKSRPPNARHNAGLIYVTWHLGELFEKHTPHKAKVSHSREDNLYSGAFFEIVDTVLSALGSDQPNQGRGRMIYRALKGELLHSQWHY